MTQRIIAGLVFECPSPSLYVCPMDGGTLALQYEGEGQWCARCICLDEPEARGYYSSLDEIKLVLATRGRA